MDAPADKGLVLVLQAIPLYFFVVVSEFWVIGGDFERRDVSGWGVLVKFWFLSEFLRESGKKMSSWFCKMFGAMLSAA